METRMNYEALADATDFGAIRRHLVRAKSPLRGVWFVASEVLLFQVAALLDADSDRSSALRQLQLEILIQSGQLRPGADLEAERNGVGVDVEAIPEGDFCRAIYLPPVYLVYVPGLNLKLRKRRRAW
jgi:hypothetical protein